MTEHLIRRLRDFGEGFRHHHENYEASSISAIRETGGEWHIGELTFHFPEHFGFCYGVDKAIDMVFESCERFKDRRIYLTDQLIHNPFINGKLKEKGVRYLRRDEKNLLICEALNEGDVVVVSAFGTDFRDIRRLKEKKVTIVDSTCGAIISVWKRVEGYARKGFITVVHGKRNHEETRATVSQAVKEGGGYIMIENKKEALELAAVVRGEKKEREFLERYPDAVPEGFSFEAASCKMGMANQTTMLKGESLEIQGILRKAYEDRFGPEMTRDRFRSFDTICGATQDRQDALRQLLGKKLDLIIIVGGFNSSNTSHLAEMSLGKLPFYHIESENDILSRDSIRVRDPRNGRIQEETGWLPAGCRHIGITSGASTPDVILLNIIRKICEYQDLQIESSR